MLRTAKPFRVKILECVLMTRDDAYAFSEALRAAFPRVRFVSYDYARKFFDYKAWKKSCDEAEKAGHENPSSLDYTRNPGVELPDYFPSLGDVLEDRFWVWIEPPNWRPRWRKRKRDGILVIENFPRLHFFSRRVRMSGYPSQRAARGKSGRPNLRSQQSSVFAGSQRGDHSDRRPHAWRVDEGR